MRLNFHDEHCYDCHAEPFAALKGKLREASAFYAREKQILRAFDEPGSWSMRSVGRNKGLSMNPIAIGGL